MLRRIGRKLLWAAMVVFVLIPSLIASMNKAEAQMMRGIKQINTGQVKQPPAVIAAPTVGEEAQPLVLTRK